MSEKGGKEKASSFSKAKATAAALAALTAAPGAAGQITRNVEGGVARASKDVAEALFSGPSSAEAKSPNLVKKTTEKAPNPELNSPWLDHLSSEQTARIEGFETLSEEQKQSLIEHIFVIRKLAAEGRHINPTGALAQWAQEGGWLSLPGHADWGIKQGDWKGPTQVFAKAAEYKPELHRQVTEPGVFRSYNSLEEAAQDYADFVAERFPLAASRFKDTTGYIEALQHQPYTNPDGSVGYYQWATGNTPDGHDYTDALKSMVHSYHLEELVAIPQEKFTP